MPNLYTTIVVWFLPEIFSEILLITYSGLSLWNCSISSIQSVQLDSASHVGSSQPSHRIKNSNSEVSKPGKFTEDDKKLLNLFDKTYDDYFNYMQNFQIDRSLKSVFEFLSEVNTYVDNQAPRTLKKINQSRMNDVLFLVSLIIIKSSIFLYPIMPDSIQKIKSIFNESIENLDLIKIKTYLPNGILINKSNPFDLLLIFFTIPWLNIMPLNIIYL